MKDLKIGGLVVFLILCFVGCTKDYRTENQLKKDTGKWNIVSSEWRVMYNFLGSEFDSSGTTLFPGYFKFSKKNEGFWFCETDSILPAYQMFSDGFEWQVKEETVYINAYSVEQGTGAIPHFTMQASFTGELLGDDKTSLVLTGYSNQDFSDANYNTLFATFILNKE